jgi:hypothetical protein
MLDTDPPLVDALAFQLPDGTIGHIFKKKIFENFQVMFQMLNDVL